jgi:hypothetical protein
MADVTRLIDVAAADDPTRRSTRAADFVWGFF